MALFKEKKGFFGKLSERIGDAIMGRPEIDEDLMDELEEILITSDIGMDTTMKIMEDLRTYIKDNYITNPANVKEALAKVIAKLWIKPSETSLSGYAVGHFDDRHQRRRQDDLHCEDWP